MERMYQVTEPESNGVSIGETASQAYAVVVPKESGRHTTLLSLAAPGQRSKQIYCAVPKVCTGFDHDVSTSILFIPLLF